MSSSHSVTEKRVTSMVRPPVRTNPPIRDLQPNRGKYSTDQCLYSTSKDRQDRPHPWRPIVARTLEGRPRTLRPTQGPEHGKTQVSYWMGTQQVSPHSLREGNGTQQVVLHSLHLLHARNGDPASYSPFIANTPLRNALYGCGGEEQLLFITSPTVLTEYVAMGEGGGLARRSRCKYMKKMRRGSTVGRSIYININRCKHGSWGMLWEGVLRTLPNKNWIFGNQWWSRSHY